MDQNLARSLFDYDAVRGVLLWKHDRIAVLKNHTSIKAKAGSIVGWLDNNGYRVCEIAGVRWKVARLIWIMEYGVNPDMEIDHINRAPSDNHIDNLRLATSSQNKYNTKIRVDNKSGHKGVCWHTQSKKWRATIRIGGKQKHLGLFDNLASAVRVRVAAAIEHHGEFLRIK